jgi:RHS repeat-associated protein
MRYFGRGCRLAIGLLVVLGGQWLYGQDLDEPFQTGMRYYKSYHGGDIDSVDLRTGGLMLDIPLVSYPQRGGKLKLDIVLHYWNLGTMTHQQQICIKDFITGQCDTEYYNAPVATPNSPLCSQVLNCHGFAVLDPGFMWMTGGAGSSYQAVYPGLSVFQESLAVTKSDGANFSLYPTGLLVGSPWRAPGTGVVTGGNGTLVDGAGTVYGWGAAPGTNAAWSEGEPPTLTRQDTNGNTISYSVASGWTDTVGRQIPLSQGSSDTSGCSGPLPTAGAGTMNFPGPNGGGYPVKFCYAMVTEWVVSCNPTPSWTPIPPDCSSAQTPVGELQSVVLPNQTAWTFQYDAYGNLAQVTLPTGGTISYTWEFLSPWNPSDPTEMGASPAVATRTVNPNPGGPTPAAIWKYQYTPPTVGEWDSSTVVTAPARPDGTKNGTADDTVYLFTYSECSGGLTQVLNYQGTSAPPATPVRTVHTVCIADGVSRLPAIVTTTLDNGQQSQTLNTWDNSGTYVYNAPGFNGQYVYNAVSGIMVDPNTGVAVPPPPPDGVLGSLLSKQEYDYGSGAPGALLRTTNTQYMWQNNSSYLSANWLSQPASTTVNDGSGNQIAQTTYGYDGRGNQTSVTRVGPGNPTTRYSYDGNGMRTQMCDPIDTTCSNPTRYTYDSNDMFLTAVQHPSTGATSHIEYFNYDLTWGLLNWHKDENNQQTTYSYNDPLFRLTEVSLPLGTETYAYNDAAPNPSVTFSKPIDSNTTFSETGIVDGLGRLQQTQTSDPEGTDKVDTTYDLLGRRYTASNPYRSPSDPTYGVTTNYYDALGRVVQVSPPDGTAPGANGIGCGNNVCTSYSGNSTTVTDQVGNWRTSVTDGLGRLSQVVEPNPAGGTAVTLYQYNALDDLTCVAQTGVGSPNFTCTAAPASARRRSFAYNSLSQLTSASNPESGTITYAYDLNGNVLSKTAPEPNATTGSAAVTTSYTYDALNRLLQKSYTGMTASTVSYGYDGVALAPTACTPTPPALTDPNPKPLRTSMCDGSGASSWAHGPMGWVTSENRTIEGVNEQVGYNYKWDGSVASITYPSGRVVNYAYSAAGRTLSVADATTNYVTGARYTPPGQLTASALGSNILTANSYNSRLQPVTLAAANVTSSQLVFSLNYDFHLGGGDNGNVYRILNNRDNTRSQHFSYDSLNRISQAWSTGNVWGEGYSTDIWGNLTNIGALSCKPTTEQLNAYPATTRNQLPLYGLTANGSAAGYDIAGNLLGNPVQYVYDPESRVSSTWGGSSYVYDGDGHRVKKTNGSTGTLYWTGSGGQVLVETDLSGNFTAEYIFFNGQRIARQDASLHYYFSDHLGSHSVVTNIAGLAEQDIDYYPYGGMVNDYCATQGYPNCTTPVPQNYKFTGKERDAETGLDFSEARYFTSSQGRFVSPDPFSIVGDASNRDHFNTYLSQPQNWNLYAYTWNNPLRYTDPTGNDVYVVAYTYGNHAGDDKLYQAALTRANEIYTSGSFDPTKDIVLVQGVNSFHSFAGLIDEANSLEQKGFGKVAEVTIFAHSGVDGPNFNEGPREKGYTNEQNPEGIFGLKINWASDAVARFMGCHTAEPAAKWPEGSFAQRFANRQHVLTYGYDSGTSFSSSPITRSKAYVFGLGGPDIYLVTQRGGRPPVPKDPTQ